MSTRPQQRMSSYSEALAYSNAEGQSLPIPIIRTFLLRRGVAQVQSQTISTTVASGHTVATFAPVTYWDEVAIWRELNEHLQELLLTKEKGLIDEADMIAILKQHRNLLERQHELVGYEGKVALMYNDELSIGDDLDQ